MRIRFRVFSRVVMLKEPQIWFQNRRQTSRRKSRPLLPHEIAQYHLERSGASPISSQAATSSTAGVSDNKGTFMPPPLTSVIDSRPGQIRTSSFSHGGSSPDAPETSKGLDSSASCSDASPWSAGGSSQDGRVVVEEFAAGSHLAKRKSAPSLRVHHSFDAKTASGASHGNGNSMSHLKRSSSIVRLSLSSEGSALIVTNDGSSPSPPRPAQTLLPDIAQNNPLPAPRLSAVTSSEAITEPLKRASIGRSRDSRAWEFWCDKDARSELEDKAEKDASGSAADAIDLLRSTTGRKILGTLSTGKNTFLARRSSALHRSSTGLKPPLIRRASTSFMRMPTKSYAGVAGVSKSRPKLQTGDSAISVYVPGNDSDKENWSPASVVHSDDSLDVRRASKGQDSSRRFGNENIAPEDDAEVRAFMRGGKSNIVSEEDDFDCVQSLLSLSQGNWR